MILKKLGAPLQMWEDLSRQSKKYQNNKCTSRWGAVKVIQLHHWKPDSVGKIGRYRQA
ncbi:MAG: PriCT-2 domain-containing protein [Candidatus Fonsibacter sp.]